MKFIWNSCVTVLSVHVLFILFYFVHNLIAYYYYFGYYEHQYLHLFFFTCFLLLKMHYLDHILECPIGPSLKVVQLRRLFDWTNMAAALPQFFGAVRHPCIEVSERNIAMHRKRIINQELGAIVL